MCTCTAVPRSCTSTTCRTPSSTAASTGCGGTRKPESAALVGSERRPDGLGARGDPLGVAPALLEGLARLEHLHDAGQGAGVTARVLACPECRAQGGHHVGLGGEPVGAVRGAGGRGAARVWRLRCGVE